MKHSASVCTEYISASCNSTPACCDLNRGDLLCFGSGSAVVLCSLKNPAKILSTHVEHTDRINCIKWIQRKSEDVENCFVSGSCDKTVIIWKRMADKTCKILVKTKVHDGSVTCLDCIEVFHDSTLLLATTATDCSTKIWKVFMDESTERIELMDTLKLGNKLVLSLSLTFLPNHAVPLIACGVEDQKIHLFLWQGDQFKEVLCLPGHEHWIRCISFTRDGDSLLMASASQDTYIRIWKISLNDHDESSNQLTLTSNLFVCKMEEREETYKATLESVLHGHDNWVYSIYWSRNGSSLKLISSSMDKTIIVWQTDELAGVWTEKVRVGEVGGSNLGFLGARFGFSGQDILAQGFHGAFHLWCKNEVTGLMGPGVTCGGHMGAVSDLCWNKNGEFLITVGVDQTTRIHAQWKDPENYNGWFEIARPQIHGYDIQCICPIDRFTFASGADEKIIRVFRAPKNFLTNFSNLCDAKISDQEYAHFSSEGACVPALGLSNKSVTSSIDKSEKDSGNYFVSQQLKEPPTEENLLQNTLWPEEQKLYGHGYEVFSIACRPDGKILASACKAAKAEHAAIILWEVGTWKQLGKLMHHSLTVTQIKFSNNGLFLLSVSRDRTWAVFKSSPQEADKYILYDFCDKKTTLHGRIIWACSWSHDDNYFTTVSRDKKAIVWGLSDGKDTCEKKCLFKPASEILECSESITSVDFAPKLINDRYLIAFGFESGFLQFYAWSPHQDVSSWICLATLDQSLAHHKTVRKISFRPLNTSEDSSNVEVATCSDDGMVKIFQVSL